MCPASKWEIKVRWDSWHGEFLQQIPVAEFEQFAEVYCYPSMGIHRGIDGNCHVIWVCVVLVIWVSFADCWGPMMVNKNLFRTQDIFKSPGIQEMDPKTYQLALPSTVYSLNHLALPSGDCRQVWMANHLKLNDFSLETHRLGPILGTTQSVAVSQFAMKAMAHSVRWFDY